MTVSVLFARSDSHYKALPDCDVWDILRDARKWPGGTPVVAHPPCRAWGRLRHFANPRKGERLLATWSVRQVRKWGGYWNIRTAPGFGQKQAYHHPGSKTNTAAGLSQSCSSGGGTRQKRKPCCTSAAAARPICRLCPTSWERRHTWCKAANARTTGRTSPRQSANTPRPSWPPGLLSWQGYANQPLATVKYILNAINSVVTLGPQP